MKKIRMLVCAVVVLMSFTQCTSPTPEATLDKADTRGKTISALMNNDAYMKEVMDSMAVKHGAGMHSMDMAKGDMKMHEDMMNKMMDMCKTDSVMCKKMMDKTMAMCDADSSMCKMMMSSMQSHPNMMKSMKGMKMEEKKK